MKLAEQTVKAIPVQTTLTEQYFAIELAARTCTRTTDSVSDNIEKNKEFLRNLQKKGHGRPFEFGTIYTTLDKINTLKSCGGEDYKTYDRIADDILKELRYSYLNYAKKFTTNCRVILDACLMYFRPADSMNHFFRICEHLFDYSEQHTKRYTVVWDCSRAIADEFRTHVSLSSLMESTRYCNYAKDKFGAEITIAKPHFFSESADFYNDNNVIIDEIEESMVKNWGFVEQDYLELICDAGVTPEDARAILPLQIKTTLIQCGFDDDWQRFILRRAYNTTGKSHPEAQILAKEMEKQLNDL